MGILRLKMFSQYAKKSCMSGNAGVHECVKVPLKNKLIDLDKKEETEFERKRTNSKEDSRENEANVV